jgi:hypothetical protein
MKKRKKDPNIYPKGWNRQRVERLARYYDTMGDAEGAREIESLPEAPLSGVTWVAVPNALLPKVRKLLQRPRKSA